MICSYVFDYPTIFDALGKEEVTFNTLLQGGAVLGAKAKFVGSES
jgi:hypothetical protein